MEATANRIEPGRVIGEAFETYRALVVDGAWDDARWARWARASLGAALLER